MKTTFNSRPVEISDINHDSKDSCDSFIESAYYIDTEIDLTDEELDELTDENRDIITEDWYEYKICQADLLYED